VFHYAAVVGVKRTIDNPLWVLKRHQWHRSYFKAVCIYRCQDAFSFSSSSEVYGEPFEHPQNEQTTPLNSRLPYAIVKNVAEAYLRSYHKEFGLDYTIFRFFNTYGPKQSKDFVVKKVSSMLHGIRRTIDHLWGWHLSRALCATLPTILRLLQTVSTRIYSSMKRSI
jgi:nucleoside-diphosphate-sugar epimerase